MADWIVWGIPVIIIGTILIIVAAMFLLRWYVRKPMYYGKARIDGKTVVITGGNTGIGKETAKDLIGRGARVIILCRDTQKGNAAAEEISGGESGASVGVYQLDLTDLESVRQCAGILKEKEPKIDILINNAGVMTTPELQTKDGFELQFGTNHLGHFLLTLLLLDNIKAAAPSRIVIVSSLAHVFGSMKWDDLNMNKGYSANAAYAQSKLANILFAKSLAEKLKGTGVNVYSLHPGAVATELGRHVKTTFGSCVEMFFNCQRSFFFKTAKLGAQTSVYCAVDEKLSDESGKYYSGCKKKTPSSKARNMEDAERLWKISLEMVGLNEFSV